MKRATNGKRNNDSTIHDFNPRPREEGDLRHYYTEEIAFISIHALVKRATQDTHEVLFKARISIHALVKRATRFIVYIITYLCISIHALVKRATL